MTRDALPVVELDVIEGLADVARDEVVQRLGTDIGRIAVGDRSVSFRRDGDVKPLFGLRTPLNASWRLAFEGRRPTVVVGDDRLADVLDRVLALHPHGTFDSFSIDAPGKRSVAMTRVREFVGHHTGLRFEEAHSQLLLRVRRGPDNTWEVLVRLTPRPLSARQWRVRSPEGAVNACLAASIVRLLESSPGHRFVNLMCGSATLLIERVLSSQAGSAVGVDLSSAMVDDARANVAAAGVGDRCALLLGDVTHLPLGTAFADEACVVLPYGFWIGSHITNEELYPVLLDEAARVLRPSGRLVVLTQEIDLMTRALDASPAWRTLGERRVWQGGHRPCAYVLQRTDATQR